MAPPTGDLQSTLETADIPAEKIHHEILGHVSEILDGEKAVEEFDTTILTKDGDERIISWNQNLILADDQLEGAVAIGRHRAQEAKTAARAVCQYRLTRLAKSVERGSPPTQPRPRRVRQ